PPSDVALPSVRRKRRLDCPKNVSGQAIGAGSPVSSPGLAQFGSQGRTELGRVEAGHSSAQGVKIVQIEVTTRHGSISSDVRDRLTTKAEKLLTFFERVTSIQITVDSDTPLVKRVDIRVNAEHKHDFIANAEAEDVLS